MNVLICNVGSTSLKYQLFRMPEELVAASGGAERVGTDAGRFYAKTQENGALVDEAAVFPTHREAIERMLLQLQQTVLPDLRALDCVGFKVVLARGVSGVQLLTDDVLARMEDFSSIAPAHNPPYLAAIRQFRALLPNTPLIGAFETAFHRTMPPEAYYYSIPIDVSRKYDIRRNGVSNYTLMKHSRIIFLGKIPDHTDDIKSTKDIPSWKRMCFCILKNDHLCRTMGFGLTREQQRMVNSLKEKYGRLGDRSWRF